MLPVAPIPTARLDLVPLLPADAEEMAVVLADPSLYTFTGEAPPDHETLRDRYERQAIGRSPDGTEHWLNWITRLRTSGEAIGFVQATVQLPDARAEVAWLIGVPWQGRGFASEAASALVDWLEHAGIGEIEAHIRPGHPGSEAVARRAGLAPTGTWAAEGEQIWRLVTRSTSAPHP